MWTSLLVVLLLSSCSSRKIIYLQDMQMGHLYPIDSKYEAIVHRDDRLSITVSCKNPELALPFNIYGGTFQVGSDGNITTSETSARVNEKGYRVDIDGNIDFPILGKLHVEGLTVSQVTDLIKKKLIAGNYMKDPLVSLEFLNFKYTVLGAVGHTGTFSVDGDRITLLHRGAALDTLAPAEVTQRYRGALYEISAADPARNSRLLRLLRDWSLSGNCYTFGDRIHLGINLPGMRTETVVSYLRGQGIDTSLVGISPVRPTVEDLFIQLTSGAETTESLQDDNR